MTSQTQEEYPQGQYRSKNQDNTAKGLEKGPMTAVPPGREPQNLVSPQENPQITSLTQNT